MTVVWLSIGVYCFDRLPARSGVPGPWHEIFSLESWFLHWRGHDEVRICQKINGSWMNIFKHRAVHFLIKNKLLPRPINIKRFFLSHEILIQGRMLKKLIPLSLRNFPLLSEPPHKNRPDPGISSRNHISSP